MPMTQDAQKQANPLFLSLALRFSHQCYHIVSIMSQQGGVGNMLWKLIAAICVLIAAIAFARASVKKSDGNEGRKLYDNLSLFGLSPEGYVPTNAPTRAPTISPSPTGRPTATPSREPSTQPSQLPSTSISPSTAPSSSPTMRPSESPTNMPSPFPSSDPTMQPSPHPSSSPTTKPSASPSSSPTGSPSSSPTGSPSSSPSSFPSQSPTEFFAETVFYAIAGVHKFEKTLLICAFAVCFCLTSYPLLLQTLHTI